HHRNNHPADTALTASTELCSTPFGITGTITFCARIASASAGEYSTPFGITGTITQIQQGMAQLVNGCSTPFGITGTITAHFQFNLRTYIYKVVCGYYPPSLESWRFAMGIVIEFGGFLHIWHEDIRGASSSQLLHFG